MGNQDTKNKLISSAKKLEDEFNKHSKTDDMSKTPKKRLFELLFHICSTVIKYQALTKSSISYFLLKDKITLIYNILPYIKSGGKQKHK